MSTEQARSRRQPHGSVTALRGRDPAAPRVVAPTLPAPRGPISDWLISLLGAEPGSGSVPDAVLRRWVAAVPGDSATDDDVQLALHCIHALSYRGFDGVDDGWEWDTDVLALRGALERRFEHDIRRSVDESGLVEGRASVSEVLAAADGPSLSTHMAERGTHDQFVEFCVHRSAYQLKEADPHTWGIPRLVGERKAAFVEIQADEYGNGRPGHAHAELFADLLDSLGIDSCPGALVDRLPAVTLATDNVVTLFGTHRRLRSALLGHLAGFEMTSVAPMSRYSAAATRLGLGPEVTRFYDVHVEADDHHGHLAATRLVGGDPERDGLSSAEILFGAAALTVLEDRFARSLLDAWTDGRSSLRPIVRGSADRLRAGVGFGHVA